MKRFISVLIFIVFLAAGCAFAQERGIVFGESGDSNIRVAPGIDSKKTGIVLQKGEQALYTGETATDSRGVLWYHIEYEGTDGWISSRYTRLETSDTETPDASQAAQMITENKTEGRYDAYLRLLYDNDADICRYWLNDVNVITEADAESGNEPRSIVFADLFYDGVPELIFPTVGEGSLSAILHIYTIRDGSAVELVKCENWNSREEGLSVACLYQTAGSDDLYSAIDGSMTGFYHWYSNDGKTLIEESLKRNQDETASAAWINGEKTDISVYADGVDAFPQQAQNVLYYECADNNGITVDSRELVSGTSLSGTALTFDEAIEYIKNGCPLSDEPTFEFVSQ